MPRITVEWEIDEERVSLPRVVDVPEDVYERGYTDDAAVTDYLSDHYGWLVRDWYTERS